MTSFKRLNTEKYLKAARIQTEDTLYWKKLSVNSDNTRFCTQIIEGYVHTNVLF